MLAYYYHQLSWLNNHQTNQNQIQIQKNLNKILARLQLQKGFFKIAIGRRFFNI